MNNYLIRFTIDGDTVKKENFSWEEGELDFDDLTGMMQQVYAMKMGWADDCMAFDMYWWVENG